MNKNTNKIDTIQKEIERFRDDIYKDNDALFDRNGNNVSRQVENWIKNSLTKIHKQTRKEVIEALRDEENHTDGANKVPCMKYEYHWSHRDGRVFCSCGWLDTMHKL